MVTEEQRRHYSSFNILNEFGDAEINPQDELEGEVTKGEKWKIFVVQGCCILIGAIAFCVAAAICATSVFQSTTFYSYLNEEEKCENSCTYQLAESIPYEMNIQLLPGTNNTFNAWNQIINRAQDSIKFAQFYFELRGKGHGGEKGNAIFDSLVRAHKERGVKITIVRNKPLPGHPDDDIDYLIDNGIAEVVTLDWDKAFGSGILHSKLIIVDDRDFYVGSANTDWRSIVDVKELGVAIHNCKCLASDMNKIFEVLYYFGTTLKSSFDDFSGWPLLMNTRMNENNRFHVRFNGNEEGSTFISSAPNRNNPPSRTNDIDALIHTINNATEYINIEVMDFSSMKVYAKPVSWWSAIDEALRNAVIRNVNVRIMVSEWNHTMADQYFSAYSLYTFHNFCAITGQCNGTLDIRVFEIPDPKTYQPIEYTRVNHAKFVVTDQQVYLSTSNWSWDYFFDTGGISIIDTHTSFVQTVKAIFDRDWNSEYSHPLDYYLRKHHIIVDSTQSENVNQ